MWILNKLKAHGVHFRVIFRWYDLWVGVFIDTEHRIVYIFPMPMLGIRIMLPPKFKYQAPPTQEELELQRLIDCLPKL